MFGLFHSLITAAREYLMRRRQFDNAKLRQYFRRKYDVGVGLYSYGCFDIWRMPGPLRVGRYCSIAKTVRSAPQNHMVEALTTHPALFERAFGVVEVDVVPVRPLVIEDDVWVGHNALILPGCKRIGRGSIIGAGSVVTRDVAPYAIMAGNPARKLRDRFSPDLIAAIELSQWWELDLAQLRQLVEGRREMVFHPTAESVRTWIEAKTAAGRGRYE